MNLRRSTNGNGLGSSPFSAALVSSAERRILNEESFQRTISLERKRTERTRNPFLLMLLDTGDYLSPNKNGHVLNAILVALTASTRETDVTGWYKNNSMVGVMFTEIPVDDKKSVLSTMLARVSSTLKDNLSFEQFNQVSISFHLFPEEWGDEMPGSPGNPTLYPDLTSRDKANKLFFGIKRLMDIVGSITALVLFSSLFVLIAVLVKLTSRGPILFKQERLGQFGKPFTFLKFRSMHVNNSPIIHQELMKRVINGDYDKNTEDGSKSAYKMPNDPRITRIGRFLRRTSFDELPQLINVLKGDMSLVGPRPPVVYEYLAYAIWHRRRVLEVKPGMTGLWQVKGRSRIRFDDMVRLDLQYVRTRSLWLDIQILMQTPRAVLLGEGAY